MRLPTFSHIERELCERDFYFFVKWVFKNVYRRKFYENWHHGVLCKFLEDVHAGRITDAIINIPPRYSKSEIVVNLFCSWCYAKNPECNFIHTSSSGSLALRNSNSVRSIVSSDHFASYWGARISRYESAKGRWAIINGGQFYATSSVGGVTGEGAGVKGDRLKFNGALILDDPNKADSERYRTLLNNVISNYEAVLSTRINNPGHTATILIQQRLHENDLSGHLIRKFKDRVRFEVLCIPAISTVKFKSPRDIREKSDVALWPYTHSIESLQEMKKENPIVFSGQFQQRPSPVEGHMIKKKDLRFYDFVLPEYDTILISCDLNFREDGSSNACYSCYGVKLPHIHLLDQMIGKWSFPDAVENLKRFIATMPKYDGIIIERRANGDAIIDVLENEGFMGIIGIECDNSKTYRLSEVSLYYRAGNVWYPDERIAPWVADHVHEMLTFPHGENDDRVDAETQMLKYVKDDLSQLVFYNI